MKEETNPALGDLAFLAGEWDMEISNASFLPDLSEVIHSTTTFEWLPGGDFLVMHQGVRGTGSPWATWLFGRDDNAPFYTVLYTDDRHFSRVYQMSFEKGVWKIWRNNPEFTQSFEGRVSADKRTVTGTWSKSFGDKKWQHDFDIKYTRKTK